MEATIETMSRLHATELGVLFVHSLCIFNIKFASDPNGNASVDGGRLKYQHILRASGGSSSRQRHGMSHRAALVKMAKLALAILFVFWIKEYAAVQQRAVHVTNHGADVTKSRRFAGESATLGAIHVPNDE